MKVEAPTPPPVGSAAREALLDELVCVLARSYARQLASEAAAPTAAATDEAEAKGDPR